MLVIPVILRPGLARLATSSGCDRIEGRHKHHRHLPRHVSGRHNRWRSRSNDNVHLAVNQFLRRFDHLSRILRNRIVDHEVSAFHEALFAQSFLKAADEGCRWRSDPQESDTPRPFSLLCDRHKRRGGHSDAQKDQDFPPPH